MWITTNDDCIIAFSDPYITDEANFNITNKLNFVKNGQGYEIEYNIR